MDTSNQQKLGEIKLKLAKWVLPLVLLALVSMQTKADTVDNCKPSNEALNLLTDVIFVRPVGVVGLLAGSALFVGLSPLTALANIPEPHNAFHRVGAVLIGVPYSYTFERPLGYFSASC
ncbi:MAG: hypothetical protein DM484_03990 [Candidatus Methylumidiphilus alinenensis]|uniref:Uncharacterized protein n=1 Tax=Candidatus Methylumidiphilus alinenensis TaxID=2202197 RepID=A0A2W4RI94_9GAMM|nr:MAG: hypothetical protein DM484_03990 [Candidatus Methylumidiphilus alinenensis]